MLAAVVGFHQPSLFLWFDNTYVTWSLVFCMAAMGLTLTFEEIVGVFTRSPQLLLLGETWGGGGEAARRAWQGKGSRLLVVLGSGAPDKASSQAATNLADPPRQGLTSCTPPPSLPCLLSLSCLLSRRHGAAVHCPALHRLGHQQVLGAAGQPGHWSRTGEGRGTAAVDGQQGVVLDAAAPAHCQQAGQLICQIRLTQPTCGASCPAC